MVSRKFRTGYNRKRIPRVMRMHRLMLLPPRVHRRHGRPHLERVKQPASNQRWRSDIFLIPCWSGEVLSVAFALDCHDREVPAWVASPRPLTEADIRTMRTQLADWFDDYNCRAPHSALGMRPGPTTGPAWNSHPPAVWDFGERNSGK